MAQTMKKLPTFIQRLKEAFARQMPGCELDVEKVGTTNRYRVAVVWSGFPKRNQLRRQDKVWKIADDVLDREELLRISLILTFRPEELEAAQSIYRRC
ncbi:MAG TPA: hypothetical protein VNL70_10490 [Tepidisphaeraceae bacterium]|nr:hypothetical protein [Tepidisphaeraceae bacterium]